MAEITSEIWDAAQKALAASMERACNESKRGLGACMPIAQEIADAERRGEERARAATQFMAGDLVVLKSGGPVMTVKGMYPNGHMASCVWFVADGNLKAEAFDVRCLRHTAKGDKVA